MNRGLIAAAATAAYLVALGGAHAEILQFRAEVHAGGAGGQGVAGARADDAFHAGASGLSYGAIAGVEFLMLDAWIEHNQYLDAGGLVGTWTQFMAGLDTQLDLGEKNRGGSYDATGKLVDPRYASTFLEFGMGVGFGVGTGQQVDPPLDNSEVTDKGFLFQVQAGLGYRLTKMISLGVSVPVQASYMFKSSDGAANDEGTHYQGIHGAALLNLRVDLTVR